MSRFGKGLAAISISHSAEGWRLMHDLDAGLQRYQFGFRRMSQTGRLVVLDLTGGDVNCTLAVDGSDLLSQPLVSTISAWTMSSGQRDQAVRRSGDQGEFDASGTDRCDVGP